MTFDILIKYFITFLLHSVIDDNTGSCFMTFITYKTVNNRIIESSVICKMINITNQIYSSTSKYTIETTIIAAKTTTIILNLSFVKKSPSAFAMSVHVLFEIVIGWSSKRIKIFSTFELINVNCNPVLIRLVRRIRNTDE